MSKLNSLSKFSNFSAVANFQTCQPLLII